MTRLHELPETWARGMLQSLGEGRGGTLREFDRWTAEEDKEFRTHVAAYLVRDESFDPRAAKVIADALLDFMRIIRNYDKNAYAEEFLV